MLMSEVFYIAFFLILLAGLAFPLGSFTAHILDNGVRFRYFEPFEKFIYRISGCDRRQMNWKTYAFALLAFHLVGFLFLFAILLGQNFLPLNPAKLPSMPFWLAVNTAVSFVTNTNWQAYSGESTLSYFSQMIGLGVQNFLSAATGLAVMATVARGFSRHTTQDLGSFWTDLTRGTIYVLLPLSVLFAFILLSQGVIQNFSDYISITAMEGAQSVLPMGPAASQIAIKQLGTNGGGFFGVNSAHPFENPTTLSNFVQLLAILLIPAAMPIAFGKMVKSSKHGMSVFACMLILFGLVLAGGLLFEFSQNPALENLGFWEGKEVRFGIGSSVLWGMATTVASNGSVNAMVSSFSPLAGGLALLNMMLGEVIFGGVGTGMYGMVLFVILAVFIAGLMVGRTPEYLGKKIEAAEIKWAVVGVLLPSVLILVFSAWATMTNLGLASLAHKGPHGLTEILYTFTSAAANNGSAFAGLNANTAFYNILTGLAMLLGRFGVIIPVLAIAGSLAAKKQTPISSGTFPVEGPLFVVLLSATVLVVGALTFFPALCLGPITEHFLMLSGRTF